MLDRIHRLGDWLLGHPWVPWVLGVIVVVFAHIFLLVRLRQAQLEVERLRSLFETRRSATSTLLGQIVKDFSRLRRAIKNLDDRLRDVEVAHVEIIRWTEANVTEIAGPQKTMPFPWGQRKTILPYLPSELLKDILTDETPR
jgi:hypothetical protein